MDKKHSKVLAAKAIDLKVDSMREMIENLSEDLDKDGDPRLGTATKIQITRAHFQDWQTQLSAMYDEVTECDNILVSLLMEENDGNEEEEDTEKERCSGCSCGAKEEAGETEGQQEQAKTLVLASAAEERLGDIVKEEKERASKEEENPEG